ncbi:MAG: FliH/SctL family protein [Actinomycetota bacterium]|nr:FliH/SctL family protein [Actinomycetota bacterium]
MDWWADQQSNRPAVLRGGGDAGTVELAPMDLREVLTRSSGRRASVGRLEQSALDEARQQGFAAGLRQGREEGIVQAGQQMHHQVQSLVRAMTEAVDSLQDARADVVSSVESGVVDLAYGVTEAILRAEVALQDDQARSAVERGLAVLPADVEATVRLHPDDASRLAQMAERRSPDRPWSEDSEWYGLDRRFTVVADPAIAVGSAKVSAGAVSIDVGVETALMRVREALEDVVAHRRPQQAPAAADRGSSPGQRSAAGVTFLKVEGGAS